MWGHLECRPQVAMATAQTLFHRFFYRKSFLQRDAFESACAAAQHAVWGAFPCHTTPDTPWRLLWYAVAQACMFLAAKVEEESRRELDVLNVFYHLWQKRRGLHPSALDTGSQLYTRWLTKLESNEALVLKEIGFSTYDIMEHPHKFILYYAKVRAVLSTDDGCCTAASRRLARCSMPAKSCRRKRGTTSTTGAFRNRTPAHWPPFTYPRYAPR